MREKHRGGVREELGRGRGMEQGVLGFQGAELTLWGSSSCGSPALLLCPY